MCIFPQGCGLLMWYITPQATSWHLLFSACALSPYLCLDLLHSFTLLSHRPKQPNSSTNKSNPYTEKHPTLMLCLEYMRDGASVKCLFLLFSPCCSVCIKPKKNPQYSIVLIYKIVYCLQSVTECAKHIWFWVINLN